MESKPHIKVIYVIKIVVNKPLVNGFQSTAFYLPAE